MSRENARVIVTGASGTIGAAVTTVLAAAGVDVVAVSRSPMNSLPAPVRRIQIDDYDSFIERPGSLAGVDMIFHAADRANRRSYDPSNVGEAATLTRKLSFAAARAGVPRIVLASSIYSDKPDKSLYGRSKREAEEALQHASSSFESAVALRLPPVYGPGSKGMFAALARHIAAGRPMPFGAARSPRRFLGLGNLSDLILHMATNEVASSGVYAPADPEPFSLKDLARMIGASVNRRTIFIPIPLIDRLSPATIISVSAASTHRDQIYDDLGWRANRSTISQLDYLSSSS